MSFDGFNTTTYTYGLERISAITGSTRTEYVYDGRGSVVAEVSYNCAWYTFGGGLAKKNVTSKSYTPFGEQIGEAVSGFGYNGEYYNASTGMIYLRARFYEPEMNRFAQKDIIRGSIMDGLSLNRYAYCANDPVNFVDPSGMALRNNMVLMSDGGGAKSTAKTTPIVTKPSKSTISSVAAASKTVASSVTSIGAGIVKSAASAIKQVSQAVSSGAYNGYAGSTAAPTNTSKTPSTATPAVDLQTALSISCAGSKTVTQVGNQVVYNGKIYDIPVGIPVENWTPDLIERYLVGGFSVKDCGPSITPSSLKPFEDHDNTKNDKLNINWHIDSKFELVLYSISTIGSDVAASVVGVVGIIAGAMAIPETMGASIAFTISSYEILTMNGVDFAYDVSSVIDNNLRFKEQGEIDVNIVGYVIPGIIVDYFVGRSKEK